MWIKQNETIQMVWRWTRGKEFIIKAMLEGISPVWKKTRLQEPQQEKLRRSHVEIKLLEILENNQSRLDA